MTVSLSRRTLLQSFFTRISSPPPSAELKNEWSRISTVPICLRRVYRNNFISFYAFYVLKIRLHKISLWEHGILCRRTHNANSCSNVDFHWFFLKSLKIIP